MRRNRPRGTGGLAMPAEPVRIYESPELREALGDVLHPGGLALTDEILTACELPPGAWVLDVGCGAGTTVMHLRNQHGLEAVGVDASGVLLAHGHRHQQALPLVRAKGEHLPIRDGLLHAVLAECSLSLMSDISVALAEFWRVLQPGGQLILTDLYTRAEDGGGRSAMQNLVSCLLGARSRVEITTRIAENGFEIEQWQDRSDALRVLAARLILAGISPAQFWGGDCGSGVEAISRLRPGFYWLIARKSAHPAPRDILQSKSTPILTTELVKVPGA